MTPNEIDVTLSPAELSHIVEGLLSRLYELNPLVEPIEHDNVLSLMRRLYDLMPGVPASV